MLRSNLIPMLNGQNQLSTTSFTIAFSYSTSEAHTSIGTGTAKAAKIEFYGINKNGPQLIATGYLITGSSYVQGTEVAITFVGIPVKDDYPYMKYVITPEGSFSKIEGQPQIGLQVSEASENLSTTIKEYVTV